METEIQEETALQKAIRLAKGQTRIAEYFGISPQAVQQWVVAGQVPIERCPGLERFLNKQVTRHELRPDFFDPPESSTVGGNGNA